MHMPLRICSRKETLSVQRQRASRALLLRGYRRQLCRRGGSAVPSHSGRGRRCKPSYPSATATPAGSTARRSVPALTATPAALHRQQRDHISMAPRRCRTMDVSGVTIVRSLRPWRRQRGHGGRGCRGGGGGRICCGGSRSGRVGCVPPRRAPRGLWGLPAAAKYDPPSANRLE